ncbi:MAG TPA: hypothetical protein PLQ76_08660, partial [bacterium]|nr:hypothetical protein [bacterium]
MTRIRIFLCLYLSLFFAPAFSFFHIASAQQSERTGYVRPEIKNAINVTPAMISPVNLPADDKWFAAMVDDPRTGRFKFGHVSMITRPEGSSRSSFEISNMFQTKIYNVDFSRADVFEKDIYDSASGRILQTTIKGNSKYILYWFVGEKMTPESSVSYDKTVVYSLDEGKIYLTYGKDPKAPVRTFPIEKDSVSYMSSFIFMLKCKWTDKTKIYHFRYFDPFHEKYRDEYLKSDGVSKDGVVKYETVWEGFGDAPTTTFWVTFPKPGER